MQSRYYNPEVGRFLNGDAFATTGQGLLGNNMFVYCNNNPANFQDSTGNKMVYMRADAPAPAGFPSPSAVSGVTPPSGSGKKIELPIEFSVVEETTTVKGGTKTASILSGEFDMYSFNEGGLDLFSLDISAISLDLENEKRTLSLFDLGNASASAGIGVLPYASVLVSLWSPSVTFPLFKKEVTITLHVGAAGRGYEYSSSGFTVTYARVFGASLGVK